jgi:hypothetical protein
MAKAVGTDEKDDAMVASVQRGVMIANTVDTEKMSANGTGGMVVQPLLV